MSDDLKSFAFMASFFVGLIVVVMLVGPWLVRLVDWLDPIWRGYVAWASGR